MKASGSFHNLTLNTTRQDMARAVLEAIACEARNNIEVLEQYTDVYKRQPFMRLESGIR